MLPLVVKICYAAAMSATLGDTKMIATQTEPLVVDIPEARRMLANISVATVYRMMDRGDLKRCKIGSRTTVTVESIKALVERGL
jgi:hypothetical protein